MNAPTINPMLLDEQASFQQELSQREADHDKFGPPLADVVSSDDQSLKTEPLPRVDIPASYDSDTDV